VVESSGVMVTRRQEKVARVVKEAVSDAITHHLSDPRIEGFVSVTRVDMAADYRVYPCHYQITSSISRPLPAISAEGTSNIKPSGGEILSSIPTILIGIYLILFENDGFLY